MAKSFKHSNPFDNLDNINQTPHIEKPVEKVREEKPKKKVGRPKVKTEETKTVNIAIPLSILKQIEIAKIAYNNNLTQYINDIIKNDLESNIDRYKQIYDLLKH